MFFSSVPTAANVTGGAFGITTTANDPYGATGGTGGLAVAVSPGEIPGANPGSLCSTLTAGVNTRVVKTDAPDPVQVGQPLTYTLAVQNLGSTTATNVVATDTLPASVTFVSANSTQGTCALAGSTVTCAIGTLPGLAQATITIVVIPTTAGTISNTATVTQTEADTNPANNTDTEPTTVITSADLGVTIADSPDPVEAGQNITYAVRVTNNGPTTASGASMTFAIPANTNFSAITPARGLGVRDAAGGGHGDHHLHQPVRPERRRRRLRHRRPGERGHGAGDDHQRHRQHREHDPRREPLEQQRLHHHRGGRGQRGDPRVAPRPPGGSFGPGGVRHRVAAADGGLQPLHRGRRPGPG